MVEIFSAHGKDPVAKWKLYGGQSAIRKVSIHFHTSQVLEYCTPMLHKTLCINQAFR